MIGLQDDHRRSRGLGQDPIYCTQGLFVDELQLVAIDLSELVEFIVELGLGLDTLSVWTKHERIVGCRYVGKYEGWRLDLGCICEMLKNI